MDKDFKQFLIAIGTIVLFVVAALLLMFSGLSACDSRRQTECLENITTQDLAKTHYCHNGDLIKKP